MKCWSVPVLVAVPTLATAQADSDRGQCQDKGKQYHSKVDGAVANSHRD